LQLATEAGQIGVWEHDLVSNKLHVDAGTLRHYGIEDETLTTTETGDKFTPLMEHVHPEDQSIIVDEMGCALRGEETFDVEFRVVPPSGGTNHIKVRAVVIRDDTGIPLSLIGVILDVTQIKEAENVLKSALAQERELGELKSRFVSMASHEFRTPLATISATAETLLVYRDRLTADKLDKRLHKILDQVGHMKEIMEDVLQLARIQSGRLEFNPEHGELDSVCREVIEEFRLNPGYSERISFRCEHSPIQFIFDHRLMRHVITNLISNALKYSPSDRLVTVDLHTTSETITLSVEDQGIGISESDLKHLFEPFHRGENVGTISGTGLGLSITKEAVTLHEGVIEIDTRIGSGTTFTVVLPKR
jgi:signal transduction histidine kinase